MTAPALHFADAREAADLAAFLARLIHYDRAAAVRLQATALGSEPRAGGVLAVFGRPASFEVLAIRTAMLDEVPSPASGPSMGASGGARGAGQAGAPREWDVTVSAGQLADAVDAARQRASADPGGGGPAGLAVTVPAPVTGPPWAGVLPPRGGWQRVAGLPQVEAVRAAVAAAVAEFRSRDEALPPELRTRAERERIGREIWSRTLGETGLPLRAVHAAQAVGFLRPARSAGAGREAGQPEPAAAAIDLGEARATAGEGRAAAGATPVGASASAAAARSASAVRLPAGASAATAARSSALGPGAGQGGDSVATGPGDSPAVATAVEPPLVLFAARGWLRLRTPYGSIAVRTGGLTGLSVTPA